MQRLRLFLMGMVTLALLGLSGVGVASAADDKWYHDYAPWQEADRRVQEYTKGLASNAAGQAAARAKLASLQYWPRAYRFMSWFAGDSPERQMQLATDRLIDLQIKHESLMESLNKARDTRDDIETDPDHEAKARAATGGDAGGLAQVLKRFGIDLDDIPVEDGLGYRVVCTYIDVKDPDREVGAAPRAAPRLTDIPDAIKSIPGKCVPDLQFNTRLSIELWKDGKPTNRAPIKGVVLKR
jgi:hypothetical protein